VLKVECKGLSVKEGRELQALLTSKSGVEEIRFEIDVSDIQYRSMPSVTMSVPHFWLVVQIAGGIVVGTAGKAAAEEFGKDAYEAIKDWMNRFTDKSEVEVSVKLYGADGRLIEKIEKTR
jgi:hypothetical protein